jgi:hypothetical protein
VPANPKAKLKQLVRLKPDESCHALKRHFEDGVLREVIGAWESQLRKYPNDKNFLWVDVPWTVLHTVKGHEKNVSFKNRVSHGRWMVEEAYLAARELGIVSRPFETEIPGHGIKRGFILTPHDALCCRTKVGCLFVGPYKVPGTSWRSEALFRDGKPSGKKTIIFVGFLRPGKDEGKEQGKEEGKENRVTEGQGKSITETADFFTDNGENEAIPQQNSVYTLDPCESVHSRKTYETPESCETKIRSDGNAKRQQGETVSLTSTSSLTHQTEPNHPSVATHFKNTSDYVLLVTDGLVPLPQTEREAKPYAGLDFAVMQATVEYSNVVLADRRVLALIMNRAINILGKDAPKPFFKVMKDFQEQGGPVTLATKKSERETPKSKWDIDNFENFRDAWQKLAGDSDVPRDVLDNYYERDAMDDKPPAPWRKV